MDNLIIKSVDIFGDTIMAAKYNDGHIYAGISYFCNALGMSRVQKDTQVDKIREDKTLSKGYRKFPVGVFDQNNEAVGIRLDFVPIWLAKITITKRMEQDHPELADKLLEYQLKAKDILAEAFLPNGGKVPKTIPEQIQLLAQGNVELNQRVDAVGKRVEELGEKLKSELSELPILGLESDKITTAVRRKGVFVLGGKESAAYKDKSLRTKVYNNIYANLKYNFGGIKTYKAIKRNQCDKALEIIEKYEPPVFLKEQIDNANNQMVLDLEQEVRYEK